MEHKLEKIELLKTMLENNVHLIFIADKKASFLLGASFVIVSAITTSLYEKGFNYYLSAIALLSAIITICSVIVLSPIFLKKSNLPANKLFFGWVSRQPYEVFMKAFDTILNDSESIQETMLNDYYHTCLILDKKYFFLKINYRLCLFFILYIICNLLFIFLRS
ncbi:MAG: Pycsar system effector family protein [Tatlockia sp.]